MNEELIVSTLECSFVDEFGNFTTAKMNIDWDTSVTQFAAIVDGFKRFLLACSFVEDTVNKLQILD